MCLFPWHRRLGSHVPYRSLVELRAAYMPDAAWAVSGHLPSWSRRTGHPPVLTPSNPLSTLPRRFACARLSQPCLSGSCPDVSATLTTIALTTAACGGLRSAPDCRPRRAYLHLPYSCARPFGPAMLVTQDPLRKSRAMWLYGSIRCSLRQIAIAPASVGVSQANAGKALRKSIA